MLLLKMFGGKEHYGEFEKPIDKAIELGLVKADSQNKYVLQNSGKFGTILLYQKLPIECCMIILTNMRKGNFK